jgi:hypothetical protein
MTITTRAMVSSNVNCTSATEARIVCVRSLRTWTLTVGGIAACSCGKAALMLSTVWITFAPGNLYTASRIACLPSAKAARRVFSGASMARPMSRMRTGAPSL